MKIDRSPDRPVRHLVWRARLLALGAILGLTGMATERDWIINVAIAVLVGGFALRYWPSDEGSDDEGEGGDESEGGNESGGEARG